MGVLTFLSKISGAMEYICEKSDYKFFPGLNWFMSANHWPQNADVRVWDESATLEARHHDSSSEPCNRVTVEIL